MVVTGLFGGMINYFLQNENYKTWPFLQSLICGLGASFLTPLFLKMISSDLLTKIKSDQFELFVFSSLCLLASIYSKSFIQNISKKVLKELEETKQIAKENASKLEETLDLAKTMEPMLDNVSESEDNGVSDTLSDEDKIELDDNQLQILNNFTKSQYIYRSLPGIAKELQMDKTDLLLELNRLIAIGLIALSERNASTKYYISEKGRKLLYYYNNRSVQ